MDIQHIAESALRNAFAGKAESERIGATIFVQTIVGDTVIISEAVDPYVALHAIASSCKQLDNALIGYPLLDAVALGVVTAGWAAPLDDKGVAPASHPYRQRVRIALVVSENLVAGTVIGFTDDPDDLLFDEYQAEGSLSEAALTAMRAIIDYRLEALTRGD